MPRKPRPREIPRPPHPEAVAALLDEECPANGNAFLYIRCLPPGDEGYRRGACAWPAVRDAYLTLDRATRRRVRNRDREERIRVHRLRREHLDWLAGR